jgi:hypothetical protein
VIGGNELYGETLFILTLRIAWISIELKLHRNEQKRHRNALKASGSFEDSLFSELVWT